MLALADQRCACLLYTSVPVFPAKADATTASLLDGRYDSRGAVIYMEHCVICHRADGQGMPRIFPALAGNSAIFAQNPQSIIPVSYTHLQFQHGLVQHAGAVQQLRRLDPFLLSLIHIFWPSSRCRASRSGPRLTPWMRASSGSEILLPGAISPLTMADWILRKICSARVSLSSGAAPGSVSTLLMVSTILGF